MKHNAKLVLDVGLVSIQPSIDRWLAARDAYRMHASNENQHVYNATLFALGAAWAERYPRGADTPGAFEWYRRGLIAPETDE